MSSSSRPARCPPESSARPGFCQQCPMGLWEVLCWEPGAGGRRRQNWEPRPLSRPWSRIAHPHPWATFLQHLLCSLFRHRPAWPVCCTCSGPAALLGVRGLPPWRGLLRRHPVAHGPRSSPPLQAATPPPASFCLAPLTTGRQGVMPRDRRPGHLLHLCEQVLVRVSGTKGALGGPWLRLFMLLRGCMGSLIVLARGFLNDFCGGFPAQRNRNNTA